MYIVLIAGFYGIDDADDGGINRAVLALERHARGASLHNEHDLIDARSDGVDGDKMTLLILAVDIDHSGDEELTPMEAIVFSGGDDSSDYSSKKHAGPLSAVSSPSSVLSVPT
jgi:hypothetical protein